jgi:hypothetical protein
MNPNEALLLSVESILDDDELDDAGRNAALADTVQQYVEFTGARQAKAVIIKRDDVEAEGKPGFASDTPAMGDSRTRLRLAYEDKRRAYPNLGDAHNLGLAWRSIGRGDRDAILAEEDAGEDPTFPHENIDPENVDLGKLASFALECRAAALQKAQPCLTPSQAFAAACDAKPELFKVVREANRARLVGAGAEKREAATVARRFYATQLLTAKADEIRKAEPALSQAAARVEARRRNPEIAARERS